MSDPFKADINVKTSYRDRVWFSCSYRNFDSFALMAGVVIGRKVEVNYMYDFAIVKIPIYSASSHAITLGYRIWKGCTLGVPNNFW